MCKGLGRCPSQARNCDSYVSSRTSFAFSVDFIYLSSNSCTTTRRSAHKIPFSYSNATNDDDEKICRVNDGKRRRRYLRREHVTRHGTSRCNRHLKRQC